MEIKAIFVYDNYWIDHTIQFITRSKWSHVALWIQSLNGYEGPIIIEAIHPGVLLQSGDKYNNRPEGTVEFISINITDEQFNILQQNILECASEKYKYDVVGLIVAGIDRTFGKKIGDKFAEVLKCDVNHAMICSEVFTMLYRSIVPDFLPNNLPCTVSPEDIYEELKKC